MGRQFYIAMPGPTAISPTAGYCNVARNPRSDEFRSFLGPLFNAHLDAAAKAHSSEINVVFVVGGLLQGLNRYKLDKQPAQQPSGSKKQPAEEAPDLSSSSSGKKTKQLVITERTIYPTSETAYALGKKISDDWFKTNAALLAEEVSQCITARRWDPSATNIKVYDPSGKDCSAQLFPNSSNVVSPKQKVNIYVYDWRTLWEGREKQFIADLARMIRFFEHGKALVSEAIRSENVDSLQIFGLTKTDLAKLAKNYIALDALKETSQEELEFLVRSLGFSVDDFHASQRSVNTISVENDPTFDEKSKTAYIRISLASLEFFARQHEKMFTPLEMESKRDFLLKVFAANQMFMLVETTSFTWFYDTPLYSQEYSHNILYPKPAAFDGIQAHVIAAAKAVYAKDLRFTVAYAQSSGAESVQTEETVSNSPPKNNTPLSIPGRSISISDDEKSQDSNSSQDPPPVEDQVGDLIFSANQAILALIVYAVSNKTNALLMIKLIQKFLEWYVLALSNLSSETKNTANYSPTERAFWKAIKTLSDDVTNLIKSESKEDVKALWLEKIQSLSPKESVMGQHLVAYQEYVRDLKTKVEAASTITSNENDEVFTRSADRAQKAVDGFDAMNTRDVRVSGSILLEVVVGKAETFARRTSVKK